MYHIPVRPLRASSVRVLVQWNQAFSGTNQSFGTNPHPCCCCTCCRRRHRRFTALHRCAAAAAAAAAAPCQPPEPVPEVEWWDKGLLAHGSYALDVRLEGEEAGAGGGGEDAMQQDGAEAAPTATATATPAVQLKEARVGSGFASGGCSWSRRGWGRRVIGVAFARCAVAMHACMHACMHAWVHVRLIHSFVGLAWHGMAGCGMGFRRSARACAAWPGGGHGTRMHAGRR